MAQLRASQESLPEGVQDIDSNQPNYELYAQEYGSEYEVSHKICGTHALCYSMLTPLSTRASHNTLQLHLRAQEHKYRPTMYLSTVQREMNMKAPMRATLVDWIIEVCTEYKLQSATTFLVSALISQQRIICICPCTRPSQCTDGHRSTHT